MDIEVGEEIVSGLEPEIETTEPEIVADQTEAVEEPTDVEKVEPEIKVDETGEPVIEEKVDEPEFKPELTYKAYGKVHEMEDWVKDVINPENQEHIKSLHERAGGFDKLKEDFKSLENNASEVYENFTAMNGVREKLVNAVDSGDLNTVQKTLGISDQQLADFMLQKIQLKEMPADQRRIYEENQKLKEQNEQYVQTQEQYQQQVVQTQYENHQANVNFEFSKPENRELIEQFNSTRGDDNAFMEVFNMIGTYHYNQTKQNLPVNETFRKTVEHLGLQQQQASVPQQAQPEIEASQPTPTPIPSVTGGSSGQTTVKKRPMSVSDLVNERQQKYGY